ncbi:MAG: hypothetical protein K8L99_18240 [Anaerolineae bacterium]|nr:hypothetical protein [Anaerolineae bacterium]
MEQGQFYNRNVIYVDHLRLQHSGVVVGQDSEYAYIQSDREDVTPSPTGWHFRIKLNLLPAVLVG